MWVGITSIPLEISLDFFCFLYKIEHVVVFQNFESKSVLCIISVKLYRLTPFYLINQTRITICGVKQMKRCKHWDNQYCCKKEKTINYDELVECVINCADYSPLEIIKTEQKWICQNCNMPFLQTKTGVVEIKACEYVKCPNCQCCQPIVDC